MAEVQATAAAFDREWAHTLAAMPAVPRLDDHAAVLVHHRQASKVQELLDHYAKKLPAFAYSPRVLAIGKELAQHQQHAL